MNTEFANHLTNLRKKNGYSQEELAEKIGISEQVVAMWEGAQLSPDNDNLIALSRLYNISLDELIIVDESENETENNVDDESNESDTADK